MPEGFTYPDVDTSQRRKEIGVRMALGALSGRSHS